MSTPSLTSTHVLKNDCGRCAELEAQLERTQLAAEADVTSLAVQLARMERENARLQRQITSDKQAHSKQDGEAFAHWLEVMGKSEAKCKFGESRRRSLARARRAGLTQDDVLKVITAHARYPFLVFGRWAATGSPKDRKDDLVDAFKEEKRWESLLELADAKPLPSPRSYNLLGTVRKDDYPSHGFGRPLDNLVTALERADCKPWQSTEGQGSAHCPIHDDRQKSFRFKESDAGTVLLYCQACASHFVTNEAFCDQVRQVLQLPLTDLYPTRKAA